jgi:hypothetical protein
VELEFLNSASELRNTWPVTRVKPIFARKLSADTATRGAPNGPWSRLLGNTLRAPPIPSS